MPSSASMPRSGVGKTRHITSSFRVVNSGKNWTVWDPSLTVSADNPICVEPSDELEGSSCSCESAARAFALRAALAAATAAAMLSGRFCASAFFVSSIFVIEARMAS